MLGHVTRLLDLQRRIPRHQVDPPLGRVPEVAERRSSVGHQQPPALEVVREHLGDDPVSRRQRCRERHLEGLVRRARLEPRDLRPERNREDGGPWFGLEQLDRTAQGDTGSDPALGADELPGPQNWL
jgi:hypothetical protein